MMPSNSIPCHHPRIARRHAVQAGGIGLLGLGMNHIAGLQAMAAGSQSASQPFRACIYIFLSGGLCMGTRRMGRRTGLRPWTILNQLCTGD